jgi:hypothetical protein
VKITSALWKPNEVAVIPASASTPAEIANYAQQLTKKDVQQILQAYENNSFQMMSLYVWYKAEGALKKQIASLGMEFVGEMLARPDIDETSSIESITTHELIALAQDLGIISSTNALRLKQCQQTLSHFNSLEGGEAEEEELSSIEALHCFRTCVQAILAHPKIEVAAEFTKFRRQLEQHSFKSGDSEMVKLANSPYVFQRTTLSVLLAMLKTKGGAQLSHAIENINVCMPLLWSKLRQPQKWQAGEMYADLVASGKKTGALGLQKALLSVQGFDFVPENLRSESYAKSAKDVLDAHQGFNNFYNEPQPMKLLASLGTTIPMPAFASCMTAVLCVRLGNDWGYSWAAQTPAATMLRGLGQTQWEYFLNECIIGDQTILEKLAFGEKMRHRWIEVVDEFKLGELNVVPKHAKSMIEGAVKNNQVQVKNAALGALAAMGYVYVNAG